MSPLGSAEAARSARPLLERQVTLNAPRRWAGLRTLGFALVSFLSWTLVATALATDSSGTNPGVQQFSSPTIQRGLADAAAREAAAAAARRTPEARAERVRSQDAYRGLGPVGALALAREKQAETMAARPWRSLQLAPGQRVARYIGDYQALVDVGAGKTLVAESTLPLRAAQGNEDPAPVDLTLQDTGSSFESANPLTATRISKNPADGVAFERAGFSVGVAGALAPSSPTLVDGKAFYPNTATDTDLLIRPVPEGIETFFLVRSSAAPESQRLHFTIPAGASLRDAWGDDRAIEIATDAGVIGRIEAPAAWDADGVAVPVAAAISGSDITLSYPHRSGDYHYPLTVDPIVGSSVQENFNLDGNGNRTACVNDNGDPFAGWNWSTNAYVNGDMYAHYVSLYCSNRGLTVYGYQGGYYQDNWYGEYTWLAPRPSSFMERADFGYVSTTNRAGTCTVEGIWAANRNDWDWGTWYDANGASGGSPSLRSGAACSDLNGNYKQHCVGSSCVPGNPSGDATGTPRNSMVFGMVKFNSEYLANWSTVRMEGATIWLYDQDSPSALTVDQLTTVPSGWVHSVNLHTVVGSDDNQGGGGTTGGGLGIKRFQLWRNGQYVTENPNGCVADRRNYCPVHWGTTFDYGTDLAGKPVIPQGINTYQAVAYDVLGKSGLSGQWTVKVDRDGPSIAPPTGALAAANGQAVGPGSYDISATATDGPSSVPASGVQTMDISIDGTNVAHADQASAGDNQPLSIGWTLDWDQYPLGTHTVTISATDRLGHPAASRSVSITTLPDSTGRASWTAQEDSDTLDDSASSGISYRPAPTGGDPGSEPVSTVCTVDPESETGGYCGAGDTTNTALQEAKSEPPLEATSGNPLYRLAVGLTGGYGYSENVVDLDKAPAKPWPWSDPNFQALAIRRARLIVPWDIVTRANSGSPGSPARNLLSKMDNWFLDAQAAQVQNFVVSFEKTRSAPSTTPPPSVGSYSYAVTKFREHMTSIGVSVKYYTAWNEPNHRLQPTANNPKRAGQYYNKLDALCGNACAVLAGDFLDAGLKNSYLTAYKNALERKSPPLWSYHPYQGGARHGSQRFRDFLSATSGTVWLAEAGAHVRDHVSTTDCPATYTVAQKESCAKRDLEYLYGFGRIGNRVKRFYLYTWTGQSSFDTGLLDYVDGHLRTEPYNSYNGRTNP